MDGQNNVVWGASLGLAARQLALGDVFDRLQLPEDVRDDGIRAAGLIELPVKIPLLTAIEPYRRLEESLAKRVLRPEALLVFPYDWRRSLEEAGGKLADAAELHLRRWRKVWAALPTEERRELPEPKLSLVCHSMGGLVARWFAEVVPGGRELVRQIITLGTPFAGSLNALRILTTGEYLPFGLLAGRLRALGRTLPGVHELVARYRCVQEGDGRRTITVSDMVNIGADRALSAAAIAVHERLDRAVQEAGDRRCPIHPLVGVRQPTLQSVRLEAGAARFTEDLEGEDHRGDGTVYRYSAAPKAVKAMPLPQSHGSLAKSPEALSFVGAVLTDRDLGEVQAPRGFGIRVPEVVRPREVFEVQIHVDDDAAAIAAQTLCRVDDVESNVQVAAEVFRRRADGLFASLSVPSPGLYRASVALGGYSAVEDLLLAVAE